MRNTVTILGLLLLLLGAACGEWSSDSTDQGGDAIGGLEKIRERGELRVVRPRRGPPEMLPRQGNPLDFEYELVERYAKKLGVEVDYVFVDSRAQLILSLLEDRGDVIVGNFTATGSRKKQVAFTVPVNVVREQIVTRSDDVYLRAPGDLEGRRIAVRTSSSFWNTVGGLREQYPGIELQQVPEDVDIETIIHRVAVGQYDVTVADSNVIEAYTESRTDIMAAFDVSRDRAIAWAVRPGDAELLADLNRFLTEIQLVNRDDELLTDDFDEIGKRRLLRLLTPNTATTYFMWRGELMGFEYELVREFARDQGLRLEVIVPPDNTDLFEWLRQGRGDLVAAGLPASLDRDGVSVTRPVNLVTQVVVSRDDDRVPRREEDLAGRLFRVKRSSSHWHTLERLRARGIALELSAVPEAESTEEIIGKVADGAYDLTLADDNRVSIELSWREDITVAFPVTDRQPVVWAVRESNPKLRAALDGFLLREYRGLAYNVIHDRYFGDPERIRRHHSERFEPSGNISPYDALVKKYARKFGFDWRLIVAQMYQESRFDPQAESFAGAYGLMQVLPRTGLEFGFENLDDPETAIHAGVKYLDWARRRFPDVLSVRDRTWFALAAYNAGPGHVRQARRLARDQGLDPDRWFGNVEQTMLLLSRPDFASESPHGYCRCWEPVRYVRDIRTRYNAYVEMLGS